MTTMSIADAQAILADRNVIAVGARGDDERRRRHGTKTSFVRVFEVHTEARPSTLPAALPAGEIRVTGRPATVAAAVAAVQAVHGIAGAIPVTAYSLADLLDLAGGRVDSLADVAGRLAGAGLATIAEAPIDLLPDAVAADRAARAAGLDVPRLTVHQPSDDQAGGPNPLRHGDRCRGGGIHHSRHTGPKLRDLFNWRVVAFLCRRHKRVRRRCGNFTCCRRHDPEMMRSFAAIPGGRRQRTVRRREGLQQ